jgi:hypothetical protein
MEHNDLDDQKQAASDAFSGSALIGTDETSHVSSTKLPRLQVDGAHLQAYASPGKKNYHVDAIKLSRRVTINSDDVNWDHDAERQRNNKTQRGFLCRNEWNRDTAGDTEQFEIDHVDLAQSPAETVSSHGSVTSREMTHFHLAQSQADTVSSCQSVTSREMEHVDLAQSQADTVSSDCDTLSAGANNKTTQLSSKTEPSEKFIKHPMAHRTIWGRTKACNVKSSGMENSNTDDNQGMGSTGMVEIARRNKQCAREIQLRYDDRSDRKLNNDRSNGVKVTKGRKSIVDSSDDSSATNTKLPLLPSRHTYVRRKIDTIDSPTSDGNKKQDGKGG